MGYCMGQEYNPTYDILFIYTNEDRERVMPLMAFIEELGWSVWRDRMITPGTRFEEIIKEGLSRSRCTLVVWSERSVQSHWVKAEAREAQARGKLLSVMIDDVTIPVELRSTRAIRLDMSEYHGDNEKIELLVAAVEDITGKPPRPYLSDMKSDDAHPDTAKLVVVTRNGDKVIPLEKIRIDRQSDGIHYESSPPEEPQSSPDEMEDDGDVGSLPRGPSDGFSKRGGASGPPESPPDGKTDDSPQAASAEDRPVSTAMTTGASIPTPSEPPPPIDTATKDRRIDAAVPSNAELGRQIDVLVQVRFPDSPPLSLEKWPTKKKPSSIEESSDPVQLEFPVEPGTGKLVSAKLEVRIVAPDFNIEGSDRQKVEVPPDQESKLVSFLLTTLRPGECRINVVVYSTDQTYLGTLPLETVVGTTESPPETIVSSLKLSTKVSEHALSRSSWASGSFYLFAFLCVIGALGVLVKVVGWYALPIIIIGGVIVLPIIGALQLRQDNRLSQKKFLDLVSMAFKQLPLISKLTGPKKTD